MTDEMRARRPASSSDLEQGETGDLIEALRRLAQDTRVPEADPQAERALLDAFDAAWERKPAPARSGRWRSAAAASLLAVAATVMWAIASWGRAPAPARSPVAPLATTEFVIWPGAAELPRFESGHLMRMELPVSALPSLGLVPPPSRAAVVQADVLVGQDGFPRAVRLSPGF